MINKARFLAACRSRQLIQRASLRVRKSGLYLTIRFSQSLEGYSLLLDFRDWLVEFWDRKAVITSGGTSGGTGGGTFRLHNKKLN